jgi:hypothetical protein
MAPMLLGATLVQTVVLCVFIAFWIVAIAFTIMSFRDIWYRRWSLVALVAAGGVMVVSYLVARS